LESFGKISKTAPLSEKVPAEETTGLFSKEEE